MRNLLMANVCGMVFLVAFARAQSTTAPAANFPKGTFALTLEADYAHSFDISPARIEAGSVGVGYYFFDNFSLNLEFAGLAVQQPGPDSVIAEGDLKLRHHLLNAGRFSFYLDAGGGISYATARTPAGGTNFDFTVQTGPGVAFQLYQNVYLTGGVRFWHLSNARIEGSQRNPSINAWEGYAGLMMTF